MATISFFAGDASLENIISSGIGFYGSSGFGSSVAVGQYQDDTYITDSQGATNGGKAKNVKYYNTASGYPNGSAARHLRTIANGLATLNVRFTHSTGVKTQNTKLRIYDRTSISNEASGVTTKVAELIHPASNESLIGSGSNTWSTPAGTGYMTLANSPGMSGLSPSGSNTIDSRHDWYLALSASPDTIGSKTQYALWIELEYL
jgi:hypothetical protein